MQPHQVPPPGAHDGPHGEPLPPNWQYGPYGAPPPQQPIPNALLDDPVLRRARAMLAAASAPPPAPVPAESSSSGEDLMARIARLAQTEVEPPLTFEPLK